MKVDIYASKKDACIEACKLMLCICEAGFIAELQKGSKSSHGTRRFIVSESTEPKGRGHQISFEYIDEGADEYTEEVILKNSANIVPMEIEEKNENFVKVEEFF